MPNWRPRKIRSGAWPIYFEEGWGREPLYHYLVAFTLNFIPDPTSALRFVSGVLGLVQLLAAYFLFRKLVRRANRFDRRGVDRRVVLDGIHLAGGLAQHHTDDTGDVNRAGILDCLGGKVQRCKEQRLQPSAFILHPARRFAWPYPLHLSTFSRRPVDLSVVCRLSVLARARIDQGELERAGVFFGMAALVALPLFIYLAHTSRRGNARAFQTEPIRAYVAGQLCAK